MRWKEDLSAKSIVLCVTGIGCMYAGLALYMLQVSTSLIFLLLGSVCMVTVISMLLDWYLISKRLQKLRQLMDSLSEAYLIGEMLGRPRNPIEYEYYQIMKTMSHSAIGAVEQARRETEDYYDFVESWVHEIKTPLTATSLLLANNAKPKAIQRELRRADNLTETILTYARLRTIQNDLQIGRVCLRDLCDQALREEMELLIVAGISVELQGDANVYTDSKLFLFVLKQLLINCAKYCRGCQIQITIESSCLRFSDNGPGIPSHELPRIMERGFTGEAYRRSGQSTGMGLYIVNELCAQMNIQIQVESQEGQGTVFIFRFLGEATQ